MIFPLVVIIQLASCAPITVKPSILKGTYIGVPARVNVVGPNAVNNAPVGVTGTDSSIAAGQTDGGAVITPQGGIVGNGGFNNIGSSSSIINEGTVRANVVGPNSVNTAPVGGVAVDTDDSDSDSTPAGQNDGIVINTPQSGIVGTNSGKGFNNINDVASAAAAASGSATISGATFNGPISFP